jgi:hypothetical protein
MKQVEKICGLDGLRSWWPGTPLSLSLEAIECPDEVNVWSDLHAVDASM